jgi:hypothetical protein
MVSCRADVEAADAALVEEAPSFAEEEEPFLAINPILDDRRNKDSDDKMEDGGAGINAGEDKLAIALVALVVSTVLE